MVSSDPTIRISASCLFVLFAVVFCTRCRFLTFSIGCVVIRQSPVAELGLVHTLRPYSLELATRSELSSTSISFYHPHYANAPGPRNPAALAGWLAVLRCTTSSTMTVPVSIRPNIGLFVGKIPCLTRVN